MRQYLFLLLAAFVALSNSHAQAPDQDPDRVPVIGTSGQVEIASIRIAREKVSNAAKEADLTNMRIELWLTRDADVGVQSDYLVKLSDLAPIEDNTGKLLTTKSRISAIRYLQGEVRARQFQTFRGKSGPVIEITLDVPERNATAIRSLKGKASLLRFADVRLQFDNLAAIDGKVLEHPKLKEFPIRCSTKFSDGDTTLTLAVPKQHARLRDWGLEDMGQLLRNSSESQSVEKGLVILEKTYRGDHRKTASLVIAIAEPNETKSLDFEFRNIELP